MLPHVALVSGDAGQEIRELRVELRARAGLDLGDRLVQCAPRAVGALAGERIERLGHAHPAFTMHTYQHLLPGMSSTAANQFADLVAAAGR